MIEQRQNYIELSCVQLGGALSLPVLLAGSYLGARHSLSMVLLLSIIGNGVLFLLSNLYMMLIHEYRLTTIEFAGCILGRLGEFFCSFGMVISLVGWSAVQMNIIYKMTNNAFFVALVCCVLLIFIGLRQLTDVVRINKILIPFIFITLVYVALTGKDTSLRHIVEPANILLSLLFVVTVGSGVVFDLPTFYRHAESARDAKISLLFLFLFALPLIELFGAYLAIVQPGLFVGKVGYISVLVLICSGLIGCCLNLYSASVVVSKSTSIPYKPAFIMLCLLIAPLGMLDVCVNLAAYLEVINLIIVMLGVMVLTHFVTNRLRFKKVHEGQKAINQAVLLSIIFVSPMFTHMFISVVLATCVATAMSSLLFIVIGGRNESVNLI